ncbi:MAG: hypothetical protein ABI333_03830 [bacterium]
MALVGAAIAAGGCRGSPGRAVWVVDEAHDCEPAPVSLTFAETPAHEVDLLFVVDNSYSMADEQSLLRANFYAMMEALRGMERGLPDVHIGVVSTDLGAGVFEINYCEVLEGDHGVLLTGLCQNPQGARYLVDVQPSDCVINRDPESDGSVCLDHDCGESACALEPSTWLFEDEHGCPRCVNYADESLEQAFSCVAGLGVNGCGFEQPLEAMRLALDDNESNAGFLRPSAFLAVVIISDEDDCSASSTQLFDTGQTDIDSAMGPLSSYRCFEFGVFCDINSRTAQGTRVSCSPRNDEYALLHPIDRYVTFLEQLRPPDRLMVAAIAGPVEEDSSVTVGMDADGNPTVMPSCQSGPEGAAPGIRLRAFVGSLNGADDMQRAYTSICEEDYRPALEGLGEVLRGRLEARCLPRPLLGCADVAVELGQPGDGRACNDTCAPSCEVLQELERGTPYAITSAVLPCLEVCPDGPCLGNTDRLEAYAGAHPDRRDPDLPADVCWHITHNPACVDSYAAALMVSRREDPPPRSYVDVVCELLPPVEECCWDHRDNDGDCLTDLEDPDCAL